MKIHIKLICTLLLVCSVIVQNAYAQQAVNLEYKLSPGTIYQLKVNTDQSITMDLMGQDMIINQLIEVYQDVEVLDVDAEGTHVLEYTYKRIKLNQDAMGMEVAFDSDNIEETDDMVLKQLAITLGDVVGKSVKTTIGRLGNPIQSVLDEMFPENTNVSGAESGLLSVFPENPVTIGDSWVVDVEIDVTMGFKVKTTFTLSEINGNNAIIILKGTVESTIQEEKTINIEGDISGKLTVDIATGWTKSASYMQNMYMEMEEEGVRMPMKLNSVTEMTSL
jgi:hypothetical protein